MENLNKEVNKYLVINEKDFDKIYIELLNYVQMIKGYFVTETISDLLNSIDANRCESEQQTLSGFCASLWLFNDNFEEKLKSLSDYTKQLNTCNTN
jgi:molecular chaperone GrpE (heat shock protein)